MQPTRLLHPQNSTGKNTRMGCHALLQGIFPTRGLNSSLQHCRQILYHLSHQGSPHPIRKEIFHRSTLPPSTRMSEIFPAFFTSLLPSGLPLPPSNTTQPWLVLNLAPGRSCFSELLTYTALPCLVKSLNKWSICMASTWIPAWFHNYPSLRWLKAHI